MFCCTVKPALDEMTPDEREQLVKDQKVFKLFFMNKDAIMKMHQNDFPSFTFQKMEKEEVHNISYRAIVSYSFQLRALRAWMPNFRRDQAVQAGWQESLDARIELMEREEAEGKRPPPSPRYHRPRPTTPVPPFASPPITSPLPPGSPAPPPPPPGTPNGRSPPPARPSTG